MKAFNAVFMHGTSIFARYIRLRWSAETRAAVHLFVVEARSSQWLRFALCGGRYNGRTRELD
jgi:hypothetical protein